MLGQGQPFNCAGADFRRLASHVFPSVGRVAPVSHGFAMRALMVAVGGVIFRIAVAAGVAFRRMAARSRTLPELPLTPKQAWDLQSPGG